MTSYRVVVTDCEYENLDREKEILSKINAEVYSYQLKNESDIIEVAKNCDALIFQFAKITEKIISNLNQCKIIAKYATGTDSIDIQAATAKGICVTNVRNYCTDEVSTHAISLLLNLARKIKLYDSNTSLGQWNYKVGIPINNLKTSVIGVIGLGKISSAYIRKLSVFCDEIWVYSSFADKETVEVLGAKKKSFEEIIKNADYISIHSPLSDATKNLFNKDVFMNMKKTASIINVSRGELVNEKDLIWALENGELAGAALDVMPTEPPDRSNPLLTMDNVIITPHAAWYSTESQSELQQTVAMEVQRVLSGFFPVNLVNIELKHRLALKNPKVAR